MNTSIDLNFRHEEKFLLNRATAEALRYRLSLLMDVDENSKEGENKYYIRSLYFDDPQDTAYYEKIDGVEDREKYRIRFYNLDDSYIVIELKGKKRDLTYKKQDRITRIEYQYLIDQNYDKINIGNRKTLEDFITKCKLKELKPSIIVDYTREAYTFPVSDVRITFDDGIASGRFDYDLFSKDMLLYDILEPNEVILEVKYNEILPGVIKDVLGTVPKVKIAMSKFAMCKEKKEV
jgi:hypothetical protein